ncbi:hypothetical protein GCK72_011825 [Caenorhabditis remanei]|uniref:Uncharacterized protein n=1 Tax=Caenorhabditis remanei TaxID=31234 RepID=A0A6A5H950_CAERE|nr:hypothetical protein GCK72_011825 [Caenorhabditis remanei]KAF1763559.1 hypothetical protein GCK72_011825 [Caenorhabditis remanei]
MIVGAAPVVATPMVQPVMVAQPVVQQPPTTVVVSNNGQKNDDYTRVFLLTSDTNGGELALKRQRLFWNELLGDWSIVLSVQWELKETKDKNEQGYERDLLPTGERERLPPRRNLLGPNGALLAPEPRPPIGLADLAGAGLALLGDERLLGPLLLRSRRGGDGDGRPPPRSSRAPHGGEPTRRIGDRERPPRTRPFSRRPGERERERDDEDELEEREPDELFLKSLEKL